MIATGTATSSRSPISIKTNGAEQSPKVTFPYEAAIAIFLSSSPKVGSENSGIGSTSPFIANRSTVKVNTEECPIIHFVNAIPLSDVEISIWWALDVNKSSILQPFEVECQDERGNRTAPVEARNTSTSVRVINLNGNTRYSCIFTASAYPAGGTVSDQCRISRNLGPVRTLQRCMISSAFEIFYLKIIN